MTTAAQTRRTVAATGGDEERLEALRASAATGPTGVRERAWRWLCDIDGADRERLAWLFAQGTTPRPQAPDGVCEGHVLGLFGTPFLGLVDRLVVLGRLLGGVGWTGKTFDHAHGTGFNRLTATSRIPMFLAMPRYRFERAQGELVGFRFDHRIEASPLSPGQEVRAILYANPAHANPLMLPSTRDELVEIAGGVYLGRALLLRDGDWRVVAYFALRERGKVA